jgi:hypothetical protein
MSHSPLPWHQDEWFDIRDSNENRVSCSGSNARLIVRSVNSHNWLLAAAKDVLTVYEKGWDGLDFHMTHLRAAIAKVEELTL